MARYIILAQFNIDTDLDDWGDTESEIFDRFEALLENNNLLWQLYDNGHIEADI